jgi:transposase
VGVLPDIHAFEIAARLRLTDAINGEIAGLDARIEQQLTQIPGVAPACTRSGLTGGGHSPGCASDGTPVLGLAERLDEVTGVGARNARVIIAELGTDMSVFPAPGHAAAWARLTPRTLQSGTTARPGRTGRATLTCAARWARAWWPPPAPTPASASSTAG